MDFARKQLEKYGWSDGKGLGKNENGISEALKPKLKRSVAGIGHDAASDFTEHWWTALYDKASSNVQVKEKEGKTKKIKTKDDDFKITNSMWKLNKKQNSDDDQEYSDYFIKKAVLASGGSRMENVKDSDSEGENEKKDVFKMTDEELFAACDGRTAHKGARHGLKALGKLARIERQEQQLLKQPKYEGYSHAVKNNKKKVSVNDLQVVEDMSLNSDNSCNESKKKKKKKINCLYREKSNTAECNETSLPEEKSDTEMAGNETIEAIKKKTKKNKRKSDEKIEETNKKKRKHELEEDQRKLLVEADLVEKKLKKKKGKD